MVPDPRKALVERLLDRLYPVTPNGRTGFAWKEYDATKAELLALLATDPTTLRAALEALVQKWSDEAISAMSNGLTEQAVATEWCASDLRAALATPAPAADEARCDGSHDFLPLTCSRCGVRGTLNLSIVGEDERLDITKTHPAPTALGLSVFTLAGFAQHRPWCPEADGPADCTCGLYGLLDAIQCVCGHKVSVHTTRQVGDAVGWPCGGCKSDRCTGFAIAIAPLATPAPAADEARCAFVGCGGVRDDVFHEPCLPGGAFHDHKACHPFQPAPTPAPPTPPATEPVAALVEGNVYRLERVYHEDGSYSILPVPLAAARAEVDVEALAEALDRLPYRDCEMWVNNDIPTAGFAHDLADAYLAARARRAGEERA